MAVRPGNAWWSATLVVALFAFVLSGCPEEAGSRRPVVEVVGDGGAPRGPGVRVPLPRGWVAEATEDAQLLVGPRGRPVLSIRRSTLEELPSTEELRTLFSSQMSDATVETVEESATDTVRLWRFRALGKGGADVWSSGLLGARKVEEGIYLCASLPGSTNREVTEAAQVCRHLGE